MNLLSVNDRVTEISRAPHKIYILEMDLEELAHLKLSSKGALSTLEEFQDIDERTNVTVIGIDGDKGNLSHEKVQRTHGIVMDFRPLGIYIAFWDKPALDVRSK